jgi:uncharacterized protein (DUF1697 family)
MRHVALLRGINVGTSTRLPMAELRSIVEGAGGTNVATYLQSGNVVFDGRLDAAALESLIPVTTRVLVLTADEFRAVAAENPLHEVATDPSRLFTTFVDAVPASFELPDLSPEVVVVGSRAVYQWLPEGFSNSVFTAKHSKRLGPYATARNERTVQAILGML